MQSQPIYYYTTGQVWWTFLPPSCSFLFQIRIVHRIGWVKIWAVLSQHLRKHYVALVSEHGIIRVPLDENAIQIWISVEVNHEIQAVFLQWFKRTTVVSYQSEIQFSLKWELPLLPPSSLELWRKERARRAALILMKRSQFDKTLLNKHLIQPNLKLTTFDSCIGRIGELFFFN